MFMISPRTPVSLMVNISTSETATDIIITGKSPKRKPPVRIIASFTSNVKNAKGILIKYMTTHAVAVKNAIVTKVFVVNFIDFSLK
jgi:hypothetical protein